MKKLARLHFIGAWLVLLFALVLFSGPAQAYVYDDFTSSGINTGLWVEVGPNTGLFSQPGDGYLYFNDSAGAQADRLRSYSRISGAFSVSMQYADFLAVNNTPAGAGQGSSVILRLGDGTNAVNNLEFKNDGGTGFRPTSIIGGVTTHLKYAMTSADSGWLRIDYNGILGADGEVDFWYNVGAGWILIDTCAPNFSQAPYLAIFGNDPYGSSLSFRVAQVELTPIPLPTGVLLMGSGLLSLAGLRRFRKL